MNWFTDKLYDLGASPKAGEAAWGELAAQDAMSPATRASYYAGSEMPPDPRHAAWRSTPRMGDTVAPPSDTAWMLPPQGPPTWEAAHRFGASGLTPPPARSSADAYRMGGMANMDEYKQAPATAWRDIDRQAIEDQYGGADIHGIKLPPVSAGEPRAWRDAIIGETPADALVNWGLGGTGKAAKAALALGGLFKMTDPAEAGVLSKAGGLLRGKVGGPWEGGIRAYHSSPHDFDKFDWSKLRTGEGANTYGAGFYAAENPAVSGQGGQYWDQFARNRFAYSPTPEGMATRALMETKANRAAAIEKLSNPKYQEHLQHFLPNSYFKDVDPKEALKLLESGAPVGPRTYEVNIAARPELMLDWDKPLKQQSPAVYETLRTLDVPDKPHVTGSMAYWDLGGQALTRGKPSQDVPEYASKTLADAGIPGIRYLDQGSRPPSQFELEKARSLLAGAELHGDPAWIAKQQANVARLEELMTKPGTYNYVVTDPSKLDIMAKYGVVGGVPLGALAAQDQYQR